MKKLSLHTVKYILVEAILLFGFIVLVNNYIGNVEQTINADGKGYFDYLPSLFIHDDLVRKNEEQKEQNPKYDRVNSTGVYVDYNQFKVNKYPCGTAVLQLPFFVTTYLATDLEGDRLDGYQEPFQRSVYYSAIFYLFLSIFFLRKVLLLYEVRFPIIIVCQLLLVYATSVTHYANADAGFSHVYSLFAVTWFAYLMKKYFDQRRFKDFILASAVLGLVFMIRNPNLLIVLFVPFLAGSWESLRDGVLALLTRWKTLIAGIVAFLGVASIQFIVWYLQTGNFLVYSYQGEGFDFTSPEMFKILFSYKKGLFVYSPILLICLTGLIGYIQQRKFYSLMTWLGFFTVLTYILSSWWTWFYGCSYGLRVYIDFYIIFFIPFAVLLERSKLWLKLALIVVSLGTIPVNIIQTYQYKEFILHWLEMDEEKYWKVFLKTEKRYRGLLWKQEYDLAEDRLAREVFVGERSIQKKTFKDVFTINSQEIPHFEEVNIIQVLIDDEFLESENAEVTILIEDSNTLYYSHERHLIHFHEDKLNQWQTGLFNYEIAPITTASNKLITLRLKADEQDKIFENIRLKFYRKKE